MAIKAYRNSNLLGAIHEITPPAGTTFYSVWHETTGHRAADVPVAAGTTSIKFFFDPSFPGAIWEDADGERGGIFRFWRNDEEPEAFAFTVPATGGQGTDPDAGGGGGVPTLSVADASVAEGNAGSTPLNFVVTLSAPASSNVTVHYATANGTATAGSDYTAASGNLTFTPGQVSKTVPVSVIGDTAVEPNETLTLTLSSPVGATLARAVATGTINNDDTAAGSGVTKIIPGTNVTISPPSGVGDVTINAAAIGGPSSLAIGMSVIGGTLGNALAIDAASKLASVPFPAPTGGGIPEAPTDGQLYARKSSAWAAFSIGPGGVVYNFPQSLLDAFNNSTALNWLGGDVILPAPLDFLADSNKIGFSLDGNRARITSAFNNANAPALKFRIANGGISIREFAIENLTFSGSSPYLGGVTFECLRNDSWIYSFVMNGIVASGHSGHGVWCRGSVFEAQFDTMSTTQGLGLFRATTEGPAGNVGLPSALIGKNWRPRDFNGNGVQLDSPIAYTEPFDLRLSEGYFVTGLGPGNGISAPSGITSVEGVGFENIQNSAVYVGYRGGRFRDVQGTNAGGMPNLVHAQLVGSLTLDGCSVENENAGSGVKLALIEDLGGGLCVLNPTRSDQNGNDIDGNLPKASYSIVSYRPKT